MAAAYTRGGPKPSKAVAQRALEALVENVKLENCVYNADVVHALFQRLPIRVEAEDFGHQGPGKSYSLKESSQKSKFYRKSEPVPIELHDDNATRGRSRRAFQSILLNAGEWTAYSVASIES